LKTDILLSTFNGTAYLNDLMHSLYGQTDINWRLVIRDDGSSDSTMELIKSYREKDKERIFIFDDNKKHLGPKKSFEALLYQSDADYMMFCDQDDYWLPDKIESTLTKMKELEQQHPGKPVLIFSDLKVTDRDLNIIHPSYWKYTKVNPENAKDIYRLLVNNPVVGCTVMINSKVKPLVLPIPEQAVMHDWWIALNVARKGVIGFLTACDFISATWRKQHWRFPFRQKVLCPPDITISPDHFPKQGCHKNAPGTGFPAFADKILENENGYHVFKTVLVYDFCLHDHL